MLGLRWEFIKTGQDRLLLDVAAPVLIDFISPPAPALSLQQSRPPPPPALPAATNQQKLYTFIHSKLSNIYGSQPRGNPNMNYTISYKLYF